MREGLPLFPTKDGRPVEKRDVVKCIEATVAAKGDPLVTDTGAKMYGGHSFRVSGARMLAGLGVLFGVPGSPRCPIALADSVGIGAVLCSQCWGPVPFRNAMRSSWDRLVT